MFSVGHFDAVQRVFERSEIRAVTVQDALADIIQLLCQAADDPAVLPMVDRDVGRSPARA